MNSKHTYVAPEVFRVDLNPEQAILSTCSAGATSLIANGNARCKPVQAGLPAGCKNDSNSGTGAGNSGGRRS